MLTKTEAATGQVTTYSYDYRNRLVEVEEKDSGSNVIERSEFTYDVFDRRIATTTDADGDGPQLAATLRYVYDDQHVWADFDEEGTLTARYLYGDAVDDVLALPSGRRCCMVSTGSPWHGA